MAKMRLPLSAVIWEKGLYPRVKPTDAVVEEYCERGRVDEMPAITVFVIDGKNYGTDGRHRWLAAKKRGDTEILCEMFRGTRMQALWNAIGANRVHGHRLTTADKRVAATIALKNPEVAAYTDTKIADQIGVSQTFVSSMRRNLTKGDAKASSQESASKKPSGSAGKSSGAGGNSSEKKATRRVVTRGDGQEYTLNVATIGKGRKRKGSQAAREKKAQTDSRGTKIPPWCKDVAVDSLLLDDLSTNANAIYEQIHQFTKCKSGAGREVNLKHLAQQVTAIVTHLQDAKLFAVCPTCADKDSPVKSCRCGGRGWLTKKQYVEMTRR